MKTPQLPFLTVSLHSVVSLNVVIRKRILLLACALTLLFQATGDAGTALSIVTSRGYVFYPVGDDWKVVVMETKPPKTAAVFQIPNPADVSAKHVTNLMILTFETNSDSATATFHQMVQRWARESQSRAKYKNWALYNQETMESATSYSLRGACGRVSGANVLVRVVWPHLKGNAKGYDAQMQQTFRMALDSIEGGITPSKTKHQK